jgi:hypothetical protein
VIKPFVLSLLFLLLPAVAAVGQEAGPVRCVITLYRLRAERWKLIKSVELLPTMSEEQLTNKSLRLPASKLHLVASVFPTDESMHSAKGADSLKLGLGVSRKVGVNAFDIANNAVAEVTLRVLDTARVERTIYVGHRLMLTRLECWDPNLERKKGEAEPPESPRNQR